jgi:hypothetical protein
VQLEDPSVRRIPNSFGGALGHAARDAPIDGFAAWKKNPMHELTLEDRKRDLNSRTNIVDEDEAVHATISRSGTQGATSGDTSVLSHTYSSSMSSMPLVQRGSGRRDLPETPPPSLLQV